MGESKDEKSEAEIMRDMDATLKRMHAMARKPHSEMKVGRASRVASKPRAQGAEGQIARPPAVSKKSAK